MKHEIESIRKTYPTTNPSTSPILPWSQWFQINFLEISHSKDTVIHLFSIQNLEQLFILSLLRKSNEIEAG